MQQIVPFPNSGPSFVPTPVFRLLRYNRGNASMISGHRIGWEIVLLAVVSVLAIFLFPGVQGPYSVVHGPASALQAARAAVRVRIAIIQSALSSISNVVISTLIVLCWMSLSNPKFQSIGLSKYSSILRC